MTGLFVPIILPFLAGFWPTFGHDPLEASFPLEARGNIRFQVDTMRFLEGGRPGVELNLAIPDDTLQVPTDSSRLLIKVEPLDRRGRSLAAFNTEMHLPPPAARTPGGFPIPRRWIRLHPPWIQEVAGYRVQVENLARLKPGLIDRMRGKHPTGEAAARLAPLGGEAADLQWLSDPLFCWGAATPADSVPIALEPAAARAALEPNPYRYYGLHQPVLTVYWERYPPPAAASLPAGSRLVESRTMYLLPDSLLLSAQRETLELPTRADWTLRRFDLSELHSGTYRFRVDLARVGAAGPAPLASRSADFQVIWEEKSWQRDEAELLALGRVLLPAREFESFRALDRGAQETYLRNLWNRHAPASPGEENPLERRFFERKEHADRFFRGQTSGMLSDRGRIYIRYGPPDDVHLQLNPQDEELLYFVLPQEMAAAGEDNSDARSRLSKPRTPVDNSAYEVWEYHARGDPLFPEYVNPAQQMGLKFVFVDELGTGDFRLAYSNVSGALQ